MSTRSLLSSLSLTLCFAAAACAPRTAPAPAAPAPTPTPAPSAPDVHGAAVAALPGVWAGQVVGTPLGDLPFAFAFDHDPGGGIRARTDDGRGTYLDFHFRRDGGRWVLHEEGALPGAGVQAHTLVPAAWSGPASSTARWVDGDPAHVAVELALDERAGTLVLTTTLDGEPHATFHLRRLEGEPAERLRQRLARTPRTAGDPAGE